MSGEGENVDVLLEQETSWRRVLLFLLASMLVMACLPELTGVVLLSSPHQ